MVLKSEEELQTFIATKDKHIIISFYVENCEGCKIVTPKFQQRAVHVEKPFHIVKVDMDKFDHLAEAFGVEFAPHAFLLYNREKVAEFKGGDVTDAELDAFFVPLLK